MHACQFVGQPLLLSNFNIAKLPPLQADLKSSLSILNSFRVFSHFKVSRWPPSAAKRRKRETSQKPKQRRRPDYE